MSNEELTLSIKTSQREDGSAYNAIQLGDWKLGRGVRSINLDMTADRKPKLVIECDPDLIEVEGLEVEAFLKDYSKEYQKSQHTRGGTQ
ncbi:TPA: hypothetical protein ACV42B_003029 [Listeria monocytogenes]|uniref:Lin2420 protein n=2 Tax=root TaxID=1 RepID=Q928W2_LISIN|nr:MULTISPECIES: hypothetical protein [Listeria]AVV11382.1 hypothetical protein CXL10_00520 [Listeria monocytogenes]EAA0402170.1 hypothetical protein [Listeria monocytogenes]EAC2275028.1 hypothetical protein [Listeria monocytogenes]EAC2545637.1 hypothetical protein [Listeria monocytogenes]EAC2779453.1 hypothetical protein [Listeria monocytogenes]